ncbi:MAG: ATP-binding cassette domain-containing protein [Candidatus Hodarchaeota archaeon]
MSESKVTCENASIEVEGVYKRFGKVEALSGIDIQVESGTVFALLGPNGSGKTTLVRILTTLLKPDSGTARVGGFDVVHEASKVRPIIGLAGQYPAVDENLTGKENLVMIGRLYHLGKNQSILRADEMLADFDIADAANRRTKTYSGGMRRRLDLAATLVANPSILFLDEPTTGLDPRSRLGLWEVIKSQAKQCNSVLLTTQYLEEADRLADRIAIMEKGKIIRQGTSQELKECCGGEVQVKVRLADRAQTSRASELLKEITRFKLNENREMGEISFPPSDRTSILAEVVRLFDIAGIEIAELGLTQPTLDDVFLSITGHIAEESTQRD